MQEPDWLAERFEANRTHLRAVAYRMLGSPTEADDAVQETWIRFHRADPDAVENLGGWLTTVVARVCLDMLRSRQSRREEPIVDDREDASSREWVSSQADGSDPEGEAILAESIGSAMLVVLDTLAPAERIAFVLHDMFDLSFDEIAPIVGRSSTAARQLASRARRRVRATDRSTDIDLVRQRSVVNAFLAAAREGNFDGLLAVLDPNVVVRADGTAARLGAPLEGRGAATVARLFVGRAHGARSAVVNGAAGVVVLDGDQLFLVFEVTIRDGRIVALEFIADPEHLRQLDVAGLDR